MYYPRMIDESLRHWADEPNRKPLVLRGARQTGKTSSVRELGCRYEQFFELNLERAEDLRLVRACRSAEDLLLALGLRFGVPRIPERALLFIDEIQQHADCIAWLRFLYEDHPGLSVIAAGSLLERRLADAGFSFPVGRVTFRTLRPMTFMEFLCASGRDVLAGALEQVCATARLPPPVMHEEAMAAFRDYLLVGGMPEAVVRWNATGDLAVVHRVHRDLRQAFAEDIQKYRGHGASTDLEEVFAAWPAHLGKRIRYTNFVPGRPSHRMKAALDKLEGALLVTRVWPTSSLALPLGIRPKSAPKLLPLDTGLELERLGVGFAELAGRPLDDLLDGRLAEMLVGQELLAASENDVPLYFWVAESSRANAETDYLVPIMGRPVPVEVKAGASGSLKSLHQFLLRSGMRLGVRLHAGAGRDERLSVQMPNMKLKYRLLTLPLYLAGQIEPLVAAVV